MVKECVICFTLSSNGVHTVVCLHLCMCVCGCLIIMHTAKTGQLSPIVFPSALAYIKTALSLVHNNTSILLSVCCHCP